MIICFSSQSHTPHINTHKEQIYNKRNHFLFIFLSVCSFAPHVKQAKVYLIFLFYYFPSSSLVFFNISAEMPDTQNDIVPYYNINKIKHESDYSHGNMVCCCCMTHTSSVSYFLFSFELFSFAAVAIFVLFITLVYCITFYVSYHVLSSMELQCKFTLLLLFFFCLRLSKRKSFTKRSAR